MKKTEHATYNAIFWLGLVLMAAVFAITVMNVLGVWQEGWRF
ncbi:unnamed protein product [marine sediment metagenome]|uniref:Uncharacterized protein n=1 Tax=marine sediment metagenome TaxID=412755 RepID=X1TT00_9ZZZZ